LNWETEIAIVGAGPQALTLITHLRAKKGRRAPSFVVLDPSGGWMHQWGRQFAAQEIPFLRSPIVHHPETNPNALRDFAESRSCELFPPYDRPGRQLFEEFCQQIIQRQQLGDHVVASGVKCIRPLA
jgi:cation diffusion facilitator CzcD-associated flavoprotein CzcO